LQRRGRKLKELIIGKLSKAKSPKANFPKILSTFFAAKDVTLISFSQSVPPENNHLRGIVVDVEADARGLSW